MSQGKHPEMATARVQPTPDETDVTPERPQGGRKNHPVEDKIDYLMVRKARSLAVRRGEKAMAWSDFKKKLAR
jgi:hypothetical protein